MARTMAIKIRTISNYMDEDIRRGDIVKVIGMTNGENGLSATCKMHDGSVWEYFEQNTVNAIGIIANEIRPAIPTDFVLVDED